LVVEAEVVLHITKEAQDQVLHSGLYLLLVAVLAVLITTQPLVVVVLVVAQAQDQTPVGDLELLVKEIMVVLVERINKVPEVEAVPVLLVALLVVRYLVVAVLVIHHIQLGLPLPHLA
jgi:hypothetical protein